ncbi:hypothetical protein V495_06827 [Pseudogymnoascus sp. VKM F-4514 (FW-929)]|nr:hypothetical protein V495_06827 [Pseudogymnoascus sp. VKM F-4514 (FW-929)]KFY61076.1 hypothetical protein V497_03202 [Pseudogymnoascus sp. VKM F-4516 (FW-969)]
MTSQRRKNKEYYAVVNGRVDEPTIFSSWGDVHPRVTGCHAKYKAFLTAEAARAYMKKEGVAEPREVIKAGAGMTSPSWGSDAYYAVAHGKQPGITPYWYGSEGAEPNVKQTPGACYKRFGTRDQAESFIEDWKETFADVWRRAIIKGLDQGLRPRDMKLGLEGILHATEGTDISDGLGLGRLNLEG